MVRWLRVCVVMIIGVAYWSSPLGSQVDARIQYSVQSSSHLEGVFIDTVRNTPISFTATEADGMLTVRIALAEQAVTIRKGRGELHVESNRNTAREFSTISENEQRVLRRIVTLMDADLQNRSAFHTSTVCLLRNLSAWRTGMPLSISVDAVTERVGTLSIPVSELRAARRRAIEELRATTPGDIEPESTDASIGAITSLCNRIGSTQRACYPISLKPYKERCEVVLVGGRTCRGRCGTTCAWLCPGQKYTQDCHSHDRCADVKGIAHPYCDWIFKAAFDDCALAPNCVDAPGVWTLKFRWATGGGSVPLKMLRNKTFMTGDGYGGSWEVIGSRFKLTFSAGCKPVYTGSLSSDRLRAMGTMKCRTNSSGGTFIAEKTNGVLAGQDLPSEDSTIAPVLPRGEISSGAPD